MARPRVLIPGGVAAMCLGLATADAGGDSRAVRITSFSRVSADRAVFVLKGLTGPAAYKCSQATIHARYSPWWRWPWEADLVTRKQHCSASAGR